MYITDNHPGPIEDPLLEGAWSNICFNELQRAFVFGFSSLKSLYLWFNSPDQITWLKENNFKIAVYRMVGPALIGEKQIIVRRDDIIFSKYLTEKDGGF